MRSPGQVGHQLGSCLDSGKRSRLDAEPQGRRKTDGPNHPKRVLLEAGARVTDCPQHAGAGVGQTSVQIDECRRFAGAGAPCHRIDREVAPGEVEFDGIAELDPVRPAEVGVVVVRPEGRDLEFLVVAADRHRSEPVLVNRIRKQLDDALRKGIRCEIPILGNAPEDDVPKRATDDIRSVPGVPERREDVVDGGRDRVGEGRLDGARRRVRAWARRRGFGQFRPRKRYVRQASLRSSPRYGVNSE